MENRIFIWKNMKGYLILLGLIIGVCNYTNIKASLGIKLNHYEISEIVNNTRYEPVSKNKKMIDSIKMSLIGYIVNSKNIEINRKQFIISEISDIKVSIVPARFIKTISKSDPLGMQFNYLDMKGYEMATSRITDVDRYIKPAIILNSDYFNSSLFNYYEISNAAKVTTVSHELWHLVDRAMTGKSNANDFYSDIIHLEIMLDSDIVDMNELGSVKLMLKSIRFSEIRRESNTPDEFYNTFSSNIKYMSDTSEVFVRYKNFKNWLKNRGIIDNVFDDLKKEHIMLALNDSTLINGFNEQSIDFLNLIFLLNIDITVEHNTYDDVKTLEYINTYL